MTRRHGYGPAWRGAAVGLAALALLAAGTCGKNRDGNAVTTQPGRRLRNWPGTTGQVNRLVVWLRGTGPAGFVVVVNTVQLDPRGGVKFVVEEGSYAFRLYPADAAGKPVLEKAMGEWPFSEAEARARWSPGGWGGEATFTFLLPWQRPAPAPGTGLLLITEFKPQGRAVLVPHRLAFTVQPRLTPGP